MKLVAKFAKVWLLALHRLALLTCLLLRECAA
jgi:hypothetical protein